MFASLILSVVLTQVPPVVLPCTSGETSPICTCKQGSANACAALTDAELETVQRLLHGTAMAEAAKEAAKARDQAPAVVDTGCPQDPNDDEEEQKCTGQEHHVISKAIWLALQEHRILKGQYEHRDSRFVTRAKDLKAHCGYQDWHRKLDEEIAEWVRTNKDATTSAFEAYLREIYRRPDLLKRFPNGF